MASGFHIWFGAMLAGGALLALDGLVARRVAWLLAGVFLAGTSAQLGLTDPLWFGSLQLRPDSRLSLLCYAVIALQGAVTATVLLQKSRVPALVAGIGKVGTTRCVLLFLLLLGSLVAPMGFLLRHEYGPFAKQVIASAAFLALNGTTLAAFLMTVPQNALDRLSVWTRRTFDAPSRKFPWVVAAWVFLVTLFLGLFAFDRMPGVPDEVAYLFQAKMLAQGRVFAPAPDGALAEALRYDWIGMLDGKWYSIFPPGWPAALAVGTVAGVPWLVNPVISALTIPVAYAFVSRWTSPRMAVMTTLLLAVSPWFLAMGASYMSHSLTLLLVLAAWLLMLTEGSRRMPAWFAAGGLLGWLFLTRPLEGLIVGVLTGLWAMSRIDLRSVPGWVSVAIYGLGCALIGALIFPYNHILTGDALVTPIDRYFDLLWHEGANRLGFGADIGSPDNWGGVDIWPGHGPLEALVAAQFNLKSLNIELLGWAVGSLLLVYVHLIWGRLSRADWCMAAIIALTIAAYGLYWFNGGFYIGPRYWYMALFPCIFLTARGIQTSAGIAANRLGLEGGEQRAMALVLLLAATAMLSFLPWRATAKYREFRGFHDAYRTIAASGQLDNALVFVKDGDMGEFGSAFMLNSPNLDGPLFVMDRGAAANADIIARYPGRSVFTAFGRNEPLEEGPPR